MKKIAVIKTGLPIKNGGITGGEGEAFNIMKLLSKSFDVHYFTEYNKDKDTEPFFATAHNIYEEIPTNDKYEALVVFNGLANPFEKELDKLNYKAMQNFDKIFYIYCDPKLPLQNFRDSKYDISDKYVIVLHQPYKIDHYKLLFETANFKKVKFKYFPFVKYPLINDRLNLKLSLAVKDKDLGYGGSLRRGRRKNQIVEWFFDLPEDINVEIFGKFTIKDFDDVKYERAPKIGKPVEYNEFIPKMAEFIATVNLGDYEYYGTNLNQRIYENILANTVSFIDAKYDPFKLVYKNKHLKEFLYVNDKYELVEKIKKLKNNKSLLLETLELQHEDVMKDFNPGKYAKELCELIKEDIF